MASPVCSSSSEMMSGAMARSSPSTRATRYSFWISISMVLPASRAHALDGGRAAHEAALEAALHVDDLALEQACRAGGRDDRRRPDRSAAPLMARPISAARLTVPGTVALRASATVMVYSALAAMPPQAMAMARSRRSAHSP